jgi:beta-lactamase class A
VRQLLVRHRRRIRFALVGIAIFAAVLEVAQLLYPSGRTLPFVEAGGQSVGNKGIAAVQKQLDAGYGNAVLVVKTDDKTFERSLESLGSKIDTATAARHAADYPFWQRLIPFSSVFIMTTRDTTVSADFDMTRVRSFAQGVEKQGRTNAANATLTVDNGEVRLAPSTPQKEYPAGRVEAAIATAAVRRETTVMVAPKTTAAALTDAEAEAMVADVQNLIDNKLSLNIEGKQANVDPATTGSWLAFASNKSADKLDISLKIETVETYLKRVQGSSYKAPGTTRVQQIDGREVSRSVGRSGRGVDIAKAVKAIANAVRAAGDSTVRLEVTDLPPKIAYDKKYSNTDKALANLLAGIVAAKGSYGISLMELNGRSAHAGGNRQFVAASTYKLYVAYAVIKEVEAGRMSWSGSINGTTVAACFDAMIVVSDNPCAVAFGHAIGWGTITSMVRNIGVSGSTQLGSTMYTAPNDLAYFLYRMQNGSILSAAGRERLIDAMKRQSYTRAGIPAGATGTVADKVGIVDGYVHDAAIVYGAQKTYVLVVMSYGGSWSGIADATRQIDSYITQ